MRRAEGKGCMSLLNVKAKFLEDADSALSSAAFSRSAFSRSIRTLILSIIWPLKLCPWPFSVDRNLAVLGTRTMHLAWCAAGREGARRHRARPLDALPVRCDMSAEERELVGQLN